MWRWAWLATIALVGCLGGCSTLNHLCGPSFERTCSTPEACLALLSDRGTNWMVLNAATDELTQMRDGARVLPDLRRLLREELATSPPSVPGGWRREGFPRQGCSAGNDEHSVRAAFIVEAVASFSRPDVRREAQPELEAAYRSSDFDVSHIAFWALADLGDDLVLPEVLATLSSPTWMCRQMANDALRSYGERARPALPTLLAMLRRECRGNVRIIEELARIGDPAAVEPLAACLHDEDFRVRAAALDALTRFGRLASDHAPEIDALCANWAPVVRANAVRAIVAMGRAPEYGHAAVLVRLATPTVRGWDVDVGSSTVSMERVPGDVRSPECDQFARRENAIDAVAVGGKCLLGINRGEFGGWILPVGADGVAGRRVPTGNPLRFVRASGRLLLVEGLEHLIGSWAGVSEVEVDADGSIHVQTIATLPGRPLATGVDWGGSLVVLTRGSNDVDPEQAQEPVYLLRMNVTGQLEDAR